MNILLIEKFQLLIDDLLYNKPSNYSFKIKSFNNVIKKISELNFVLTIENINNNNIFSDKIKNRIKEILNTGTLQELQDNKQNNYIENKKLYNDLLTITGIGPSKAKTLLENNITLDILLNNPSTNILKLLTHHQKLGIKYYYDLQKKIPKYIIEFIETYLKQFDFHFTICGSYRRNKDFSGDIDILIKTDKYKLNDIINILYNDSFLIEHLTTNVTTKYMGICKISSFDQFMRIDIRLISNNSYPFAILYFTGSKNNNTLMRKKAIKMNLKLNEYGLFDKNNNSIILENEKEIYSYLNLEYKNPENR